MKFSKKEREWSLFFENKLIGYAETLHVWAGIYMNFKRCRTRIFFWGMTVKMDVDDVMTCKIIISTCILPQVCKWDTYSSNSPLIYLKHIYLFLWSWAGGILRILQSDWFREQAVFSYLLTTVMVTNYAKRRVKLRIERNGFFYISPSLLTFESETSHSVTIFLTNSFYCTLNCSHVDETMCKIKTWLFQFFLIVSPTF